MAADHIAPGGSIRFQKKIDLAVPGPGWARLLMPERRQQAGTETSWLQNVRRWCGCIVIINNEQAGMQSASDLQAGASPLQLAQIACWRW